MARTKRPDEMEPSEREPGQRLPPGQRIVLQRPPDSPRYAMTDLVNETGFSARTIRYYVTEGILKPAQGRGPSATYDKDHLLRLRMIDELKTEENLPLDQIRDRLAKLTIADLEAHFAIATRPVEGRWRRVIFHPDLELNIREHDEPDYDFERIVNEIIDYGRFKFEQRGAT